LHYIPNWAKTLNQEESEGRFWSVFKQWYRCDTTDAIETLRRPLGADARELPDYFLAQLYNKMLRTRLFSVTSAIINSTAVSKKGVQYESS
jgi:hypothetical protein